MAWSHDHKCQWKFKEWLGPGTKIKNSVCICIAVSVLRAILQIIKNSSSSSASRDPFSYGGSVEGLAEKMEAQMALKIENHSSFHSFHCNSASQNKYNIKTGLKEIRCQGVHCFYHDKFVQWKALWNGSRLLGSITGGVS